MNTMNYKGFSAILEFSEEDNCFIGHIAGIKDIVGFHGETVSELRSAFVEAVNDYLETCKKINKLPQKPYSGKIMLRVSPEIHKVVAITAETSGKSINSWATEVLSKAVQK